MTLSSLLIPSGTFSIAYGMITDFASPAERGSFVSAVSFALARPPYLETSRLMFTSITIAPSIGPIIGGGADLLCRLDQDILVPLYCCCLMSVNDDIPPTRDFSGHPGQWINQTVKALTITCSDNFASLERHRCCRRPIVTDVESLEILNNTYPHR